MVIVMNLYCEKCRSCVGFRTSMQTPIGIFCLNCESAVVAEMEEAARAHAEYQRQIQLTRSST
jgi:hypothetical protein